MGLKQRGNQQYYYRNSTVEGRRKTIYVGRGVAAELAAETDAAARQRVTTDRKEAHAQRQRFDVADRMLQELSEWADLLVRAKLLTTGFHQHDRGQWRRRRNYGPRS